MVSGLWVRWRVSLDSPKDTCSKTGFDLSKVQIGYIYLKRNSEFRGENETQIIASLSLGVARASISSNVCLNI